jgi:exosome complex exonuclease DIS3/RRP44
MLVGVLYCAVWSEYPIGHYVRIMGNDGSKEVETQVLLHEFGVPYESFTNEVMSCLPPKEWRINEEVIAKRTDIRHIPVVSIDPPGMHSLVPSILYSCNNYHMYTL